MANNYSIFITPNKQLAREGMTIINERSNVVTHPAVKIAKDSQAQAIVVMKDFGLTVKARVKLPAKQVKEEDDDVISAFLKIN